MSSNERGHGQALNFPLPPELLEKVFLQLDRSDLANLARVSQGYCTYFQQILFRDVAIEYTAASPAVGVLTASLLLRTMLQCPELARACESLHIEMFGMSESTTEALELPQPCVALDFVAARGFIQRSRPHVTDSWSAAVRANEVSAIVALMLCCVTRLKTLRLTIDTLQEKDFVSELLKDMAVLEPGLPIFEELREATYHRLWEYSLYETSSSHSGECWAFFQLEKLQSLNVSTYETRLDIQQIGTHPLGMNLRSLILGKQSCITGQTLGHMLKNAPKLEVLVYDFYYWHPQDPRLALFNGDDIGEALQYVKRTLRHLHISTKFWEVDAEPAANSSHMGFRGRLGSLADFAALETFEVPLVVILGWSPSEGVCLKDLLPQSLKHFICRNDSCTWTNWSWDYNETTWGEHYPFVKDGDKLPRQTFDQLSSLFESSESGRQLEELTLLVKDMEDPDKTVRWPPWPWTPALITALRDVAGDTTITYHECGTGTCDAAMCKRWHTYVSRLETRMIPM